MLFLCQLLLNFQGAYALIQVRSLSYLLKKASHFFNLADLKFYSISSFLCLTSMKRPKNRGQKRPFFTWFFPRFFAKNHHILCLNPSIFLSSHNSASLLPTRLLFQFPREVLSLPRHQQAQWSWTQSPYPASVFPLFREHLNSLNKGFHKLFLFCFRCGMVDFIKCQ